MAFIFATLPSRVDYAVKRYVDLKVKEISTDSEGYLKETTQWSEALAVAIAANEGIEPLRTLGSRASCANFTRVYHLSRHPNAGKSDGE